MPTASFTAPAFHGNLSDIERQHALATWKARAQSEQRIIFAIMVSGAGIDYAGVRLVVYAGPLYSTIEYVQGRDAPGMTGSSRAA
jgi:superfamily II DNA helicase RecQ